MARQSEESRWAVVLAGGDGSRLRALTRKIVGSEMPKQFCPMLGETTLLTQTLKRASLLISSHRSLVVVNRHHERLYTPLLAQLSPEQIVVQPQNRGTTPAILFSLLRLAEFSPDASVVLLPSDHYVNDNSRFMAHVDSAFETIAFRPELTVLLGIKPNAPEVGYGWIEPGRQLGLERASLFTVRRFWEKPRRELAQNLLARGCLWNSFVIVARVHTLLALIMKAAPRLYFAFSKILPALGTIFEDGAVQALYRSIASGNFSEDVLAREASDLTVMPVRGVEWSDLGEPQRAMSLMERLGAMPQWAAA